MHGPTIKKYKSIETFTFTYNPLRLQLISIFFRSFSRSLHQTSIYKTQTKYQLH